MALFPAYSSGDLKNNAVQEQVTVCASQKPPSEYTENELLASDPEESPDEPQAKVPRVLVTNSPPHNDDFYIDCKLDRGNLRVSTLYYPGRPQYECVARLSGAGRAGKSGGGGGGRPRRYFTRRAPDPDDTDVEPRAAAYRKLLAERPHDVALWETYIDFQERCAGEAAALGAAEEAAERAPRCGRLRARLLGCLRAALPPHELRRRLRALLARERSAAARLPLWEALLGALGAERGADAGTLTAAAAAALADTPRAHAPRLLHALGSYLRAAGRWERLVLLIELTVAMNYAPAALPPPDPAVAERAERRALELEDQATASGLPLSAVWVRVERARAAAHWRPAPPAPPQADPQRAPLPHDVADLLLPVAADDQLLHLSVRLLMLAKVPMLPATEHWARRAGGAGAGGGGEALLPLLAAAHGLPPAHPARAPAGLARRLLALLVDPPHYFSDDTGYRGWVDALWEACGSRARGLAHAALVCWRLRWLRALAVAAGAEGEGAEEARRLSAAGRALLRRRAPASPLPYAEWARLERAAGGGERAALAAGRALRAALADVSCPPHHALYVARVVCEVSGAGAGAGPGEEGRAALVAAALGRPPARGPPAPHDLHDALQRCEQRCEAIERELEAAERSAGEEEEEATGYAEALLPGAGEWARARVALASPARRVQLLQRTCGAAPAAASAAAVRYWEETAEALAATCRAAPRLAPLFPHNAALALAAAGAPLWAGAAGGAGGARGAAALLRALLGALRTQFAAAEAEALVRVCARACGARGAGADEAALAGAARLEAEARAPRPRLAHALYAALERAPYHKWLYVRGAAWCAREAGVLPDAVLERGLRLHALPAELEAARPAAAPQRSARDDGD